MSTVDFTSDVVRNTKFREKMRGYHTDEVDAFLERTAAALELLHGRLAEATERALKAEAALESNSEADEGIRRTLVLAQRTSEMAINEANEDARRIRDDAQAEIDRQRSEHDDACVQILADANAHAEALRTEAEEALAQASAEAASTTATADQEAEDLRRACDEAIDQTQAAAAAAQAAAAESAERELQAMIDELSSQRTDLRVHVEALSEYLARERARLLDALNSAVESFGATLTPTPLPAMVEAALTAAPVATAVPVAVPDQVPAQEEETVAAESAPPAPEQPDALDAWVIHAGAPEILNADAPEEGPATVWFHPEPESEEPMSEPDSATVAAPAALLFTLEDDMRREIDTTEPAPDGKPRKTLLGRRRV